jgi:NADPH2:quinone reductase
MLFVFIFVFPPPLLTHFFERVMNYLTTPEERFYYGTKVFDLIEKGTLKIKVSKAYPFTAEGVGQAHTDLTSGKTSGKLVIKVTDN